MFNFTIRHARCFYEPAPIRIRPLTIFVGENSSGKSSALALLNALLSSAHLPGINFNAPPFSLGAYDQIAHVRGGTKGRAKEFCLGLTTFEKQAPASERTLFDRGDDFRYVATFVSKSELPHLQQQEFATPRARAVLGTPTQGNPALLYSEAGSENARSISLKRTSASFLLRDYGLYGLNRVMQDIRLFGSRSPDDDENAEFVAIKPFASDFQKFIAAIPRDVVASAPVRSRPARTYNPGDEDINPEGAHVPFSIARIRAEQQKSWTTLKAYIEAYGNASGLLDTLEVRRFGKKLSDPFQLVVRKQGPRVNIVDTGYGISQVLPVLFDLHNTPKRSLLMLQQPEVHLHPRAQAMLGDLFCSAVSTEGKHIIVETHSDFIVDRVRRAVRRGQIAPDMVSIAFFYHRESCSDVYNIDLDGNGSPVDPPDEYRDFFLEEQIENLS